MAFKMKNPERIKNKLDQYKKHQINLTNITKDYEFKQHKINLQSPIIVEGPTQLYFGIC